MVVIHPPLVWLARGLAGRLTLVDRVRRGRASVGRAQVARASVGPALPLAEGPRSTP